MERGAFSVSLEVKDITASRAFYEKLGFSTSRATHARYCTRNTAHQQDLASAYWAPCGSAIW